MAVGVDYVESRAQSRAVHCEKQSQQDRLRADVEAARQWLEEAGDGDGWRAELRGRAQAIIETERVLAAGDFGCGESASKWRVGEPIHAREMSAAEFAVALRKTCAQGGAAESFGGLICERVGSVSVPHRAGSDGRLRTLKSAVDAHLPAAWTGKIHALAKAARAAVAVWERDAAEGDVYAHWLGRFAGADGADMSEQDIRDRAEKIAARGRGGNFVPDKNGFAWAAWERLCAFVERYGGAIVPTKKIYTLKSWAARAGCVKWWRRQLRRWVAQNYERGAIELGAVGASVNQWYCSDRAVTRRAHQIASNESAMRAAVVESASGQKMSLWDVAQTTVSNKAIRRGELMTRIRGCEVWADSQGLAGLFTTNTCPSRFHSQRRGGGVNPNYDGSTPADGQKWLSTQWARLRAKLAREGLPIMGFRVAEPHHDGCPHWHMLIWCKPEHVEQVKLAMWLYWLPVDDAGDWCEPGAFEQRTNIKAMLPGMAAGYVAKYISKNIDDTAIDRHGDDMAGQMTVGPDLLGDVEVKPCNRVETWASLWRIRQFQAIGQPPVTVWRELRRVPEQAAAAGSDGLIKAWLAVHRVKDRKADWDGYMRAQGGAMLRRDDYRFCVHTVDKDKAGRYETVREKWACGVTDRRAAGALAVTPTKRERWGAEGFAATRRAPPWTRLNNCTRHNAASVGRASNQVHRLREAGILDAEDGYNGPEREPDSGPDDDLPW